MIKHPPDGSDLISQHILDILLELRVSMLTIINSQPVHAVDCETAHCLCSAGLGDCDCHLAGVDCSCFRAELRIYDSQVLGSQACLNLSIKP